MRDPVHDANQVGFDPRACRRHQDGAGQRDQHRRAARRRCSSPAASRRFPAFDAVRYARKSAITASGGDQRHRIRQASWSSRRKRRAGLRYAYLQFDGIGNAANAYRRVGNLFDVKLRDREPAQQRRRHRAGVTIVNGVNNERSAGSPSSRSATRRPSTSCRSSQSRSPAATK